MSLTFRVATIRSIPIKFHISFFIIVGLFALVLSAYTFTVLGMRVGFGHLDIPIGYKIALGTITSVLLFVFLFLHELAHSLVSVFYGYRVREITFFILGGMSRSEKFPEDPGTEFKIASAGPAVSIGVGFFFLLIYGVLTVFEGGRGLEIAMIAAASLGFYNLVIGAFNMIPAFPLDGGRVLRSVLGNYMDHHKATVRATQTGKVIAIIMGVFGIFSLNLLLILIAVFIYMGAKGEKDVVEAVHALEDIRVGDLAVRTTDAVDPEMSAVDLRQKMVRERQNAYMVMADGSIEGIVGIEDLRKVPKGRLENYTVERIMERDFLRASPEEDASIAWKRMLRRGRNKVVVMDQGKVLGIASTGDFRNVIEMHRISE